MAVHGALFQPGGPGWSAWLRRLPRQSCKGWSIEEKISKVVVVIRLNWGMADLQSPNLLTFKKPGNRFQLINSASLCSLAGRYVKKSCRTGPAGWESIPWLLERFTNSGSGAQNRYMVYTDETGSTATHSQCNTPILTYSLPPSQLSLVIALAHTRPIIDHY